jgi:hypothetical protein
MAELYFRYQVDEAIKQLDEGKGIPHEDGVRTGLIGLICINDSEMTYI